MEDRASKLAWGIAYCLAYEQGFGPHELGRLRCLIEQDVMPQGTRKDVAALVAEAARLVVAPFDPKEEFRTKDELWRSRLAELSEQLPPIALLMGGATKIKQYVFESVKLPEIRGASCLLDRINLQDVRALFSRAPQWLKEFSSGSQASQQGEAKELVKQVRDWFLQRYGVEPPDCEECIIYANGGEVLAFAPLKLAAFLAEAIECLYTRETLVANSVAVWRGCSLLELRYGLRPLEFWQDDRESVADESVKQVLDDYYRGSFSSRKTFGEVVAGLALEKLRRREGNSGDERPPKPVPHFETVLYARRCQSCERRNAVVERRFEDETAGEWFCEPCARKRVFGQRAKREAPRQTWWFDHAGFSWQPLGAKAWATRFEEWLQREDRRALRQSYYQKEEVPVSPPEDLDDIAEASQPEGFIGVVYADGNNMGSLLQELKTPRDYQEFAGVVHEEIINATFTALAEELRPYYREDRRWIHPFEVLSIGGDDLFLLVPAQAALPIAITIAEKAERSLGQQDVIPKAGGYEWGKVHRIQGPDGTAATEQAKLSLSAGVLIADHHTPVFFLSRMVEELLKSAKARAKELRGNGFYGGTVDFQVLKSIGMIATDIRDFRERVFRRENLHLTAKPYTLPELRALLDGARQLKQVGYPKSQLYRLHEQLGRGWLASIVEYLYSQARISGGEGLRSVLDKQWVGGERANGIGSLGPWIRRERVGSSNYDFETVIGDLLEIYDFVPEGGEEGGG